MKKNVIETFLHQIKPVFLTVLLVSAIGGSSELHGAQNAIGKIADIDPRKHEVIVRSPSVLKIGDRIYVEVDGKKATLNVTFPMQTVAKCSLLFSDRHYFSLLKKEMPVFAVLSGKNSDEDTKNRMPAAVHGQKKTIGGVEFIFIKGGEFLMGAADGEGDPDECPQHKVSVDSFWISRYEVTQAEYESIMETNPSEFVSDDNPVENVEWYNAVDYCTRFSAKNSVKCRLPYEAEWEYACRAGTTGKSYWGDNSPFAYCWYAENSGFGFFTQRHRSVGSKTPNKWGLSDMMGNVFEWCMDRYDENYYTSSPYKNPHGPATGETRVMRGGCYSYEGNYMRSTVRGCNDPSRMFSRVGFRIILESLQN